MNDQNDLRNRNADTLRKFRDGWYVDFSAQPQQPQYDQLTVIIAALEAGRSGEGCGDHDHADFIPGCGRCAETLPAKHKAPQQPTPVGVTDEMVERAAKGIVNFARKMYELNVSLNMTSVIHSRMFARAVLSALSQQEAAPGVSEGWGPSYKQPWHAQEDAALQAKADGAFNEYLRGD